MKRNRQLETVLVIVLGLIVLYRIKRIDWLLWAALAVGVVSLLSSACAAGIHWAWTKLGEALGAVSGRVLLGVVYFLLLFPLSLLARKFGKIGMRTKAGGPTYFRQRDHTYTKEDLQNPW